MSIQKIKALDNKIKLHSSFEGACMVMTDKQRVMQVLLCLQSNALKFTQGGEVHIITKVTATCLKISVKDTGVGISKEGQKKLFKFFGFLDETQKLNMNGVGLGLVISKQIVQQFDGDITVDS